ncbi:hypothetical protein V6N11_058455 [Hibiscus sabdariffa]|uniref:Uncharacterized protein n=1 Tax=Hibiscus sabdariffa TaxID=183260 RepID=A0ABR2U4W0_9ROSI
MHGIVRLAIQATNFEASASHPHFPWLSPSLNLLLQRSSDVGPPTVRGVHYRHPRVLLFLVIQPMPPPSCFSPLFARVLRGSNSVYPSVTVTLLFEPYGFCIAVRSPLFLVPLPFLTPLSWHQ